jgi:hypothetical protein
VREGSEGEDAAPPLAVPVGLSSSEWSLGIWTLRRGRLGSARELERAGMPGMEVRVGVLAVRMGPGPNGGVLVGCGILAPFGCLLMELTSRLCDLGGEFFSVGFADPWSGVESPPLPQCFVNIEPSIGVNILCVFEVDSAFGAGASLN